LVENRIDLEVGKNTFESSMCSLIVVNILVGTGWLWVRFDPAYQLVRETFANDLMIGLAYHVETGVVEWARNWVRLPLITFSMLRVWGTCVYVLHDTSLHFFASSRTGRTSISTSECQNVHSLTGHHQEVYVDWLLAGTE